MNFWRRGHTSGGTSKTKYTGEDILQNGILDVESRLGEGGMGQVYLARNKEDGTTVAVKVGKEVSECFEFVRTRQPHYRKVYFEIYERRRLAARSSYTLLLVVVPRPSALKTLAMTTPPKV